MSNSVHTRETHKLSITIILLLAFTLRIYHLTFQPIWSDEADVIRFANEPLSNMIRNFTRPGWNGPLFNLIIRIWLKIIDETSFGLRIFSVMFATTSIAAIYVLGKQTIGHKKSMITSLLAATSPYLIWYAQDGKMYSLLLFLSVVSTLALLYACQQGNWKAWGFYLLLTWSSWYIHILAVLVLPFHMTVWVLYSRRFSVLRFMSLFTVIGILYFPLLLWQFPTWVSSFTTGHQFYSLLEIIRIQIFVFAAGYPSPIQFITILSFLFLLILGCYDLTQITRGKLLFAAYFLFPLLTIYLVSLGMPIYTDRYLIMIAPAFYGLCAIGLTTWLENEPKILTGATVFLVFLNLSTIYIQANTIIKPVTNLVN